MTSISFLGPVGTFSEAALQQIINEKPVPALRSVEKIIPALTPQDALHMVREGRADFALVPTENFVDGPVTTCLLYTSPSPRDVEESRMPSSA